MAKDLRKYQKLIQFLSALLIVMILMGLMPLLALAKSGVLDKCLGLKLIVYETTRISSIAGPCDNLTAYKSEIMMTYIYGENNRPILGANGAPTNMLSNKKARDPSWEQLVWFLNCDNTDKREYIDNVFNCVDFAETLQNNAAKAGWRSAFVGIQVCDNTTGKISGHALNAFQTTDFGLVYIDCMRGKNETISDAEKLANVEAGKQYQGTYIFPITTWPIFLDFYPNWTVLKIYLIEWPMTE
jgi:hypothetical protein